MNSMRVKWRIWSESVEHVIHNEYNLNLAECVCMLNEMLTHCRAFSEGGRRRLGISGERMQTSSGTYTELVTIQNWDQSTLLAFHFLYNIVFIGFDKVFDSIAFDGYVCVCVIANGNGIERTNEVERVCQFSKMAGGVGAMLMVISVSFMRYHGWRMCVCLLSLSFAWRVLNTLIHSYSLTMLKLLFFGQIFRWCAHFPLLDHNWLTLYRITCKAATNVASHRHN